MDAEELMTGKSAVLDQAALERKMTGAPDAIDQGAIDQAGFWGQTKSVARDLTGQVGGIAATAVDMLAGVPRVLSIPGSWAIGTAALVKGESSRTAAGAALAYQQQFLPDWMQGAWGKIATAMGPQAEEYYKTNQLAKLMDLLNSGIDKAGKIGEKAGLPEDYIHLIAGQTMDLLGAAGVKVSLGKSMEVRAEAAKDAVMARQYRPYEQTPREKFLTENPQRTPDPAAKPRGAAGLAALKEAEARMAAWNKANPQFRQQDASLFMQDVVEAGRAWGAAEVARRNWAETQAAEAARTRTQADFEAQMTGAKPPPETARAADFPPDRAVGEWRAGVERRATPEGRPLTELISERDFSQSSLGQGLAKVKEGKLWDLTAEERIALKGRQRELDTLREAGKAAPLRDVRGAADPELLNWMVAGTALATAAWNKYKEWEATQDYPENEKPTPYPSDMTPGGRPLFVTDRAVETGLVTGAMLIGAIKTSGGFFPYTTIEKVAKPFVRNIDISKEMEAIPGIRELPQAEQIAKATELYDKAAAAPRRMVKNWLTKYAGTSADPLNSITIPVAIRNDALEIIGTKLVRWENIIDQILKKSAPDTAGKRTTGNYVAYPNLKELPENEASWTIGEYNAGGAAYDPRTEVATRADRKPEVSFETLKKEDVLPFHERNAYASAFTSFLEHAGDYYRTLDPVKRNMYDFPRLIKETLADDAKKAKEASAYKESSKKARLESVAGADVVASYPEVELPERLLHRNSPEGTSAKNMVDETLPAEKVKFSWVQLKKPGQFYDEGRFMGHSVGGYDIVEGQPGWMAASGTAKQNTYASDYYGHGGYAAIKSGKAEVYSLRDNQGNSYATFEVEKEANGSRRITQMKGPGNQHVAAEAQKYAQDIATDPRWDSVRSADLDKIGFTPETFKAVQEARKGNPSNFLPKAEQGSIDPRLLAGIAAAGGLAAYLAQNPDDADASDLMKGLGGAAAMAAAGWIKAPGGMWHPEAVQRLARPLQDKLTARLQAEDGLHRQPGEGGPASDAYWAKAEPLNNWAETATTRYLNKFAGTERDPLKDVQVPFGEGTVAWEKLTDAAISGKTPKQWIEGGARQSEITDLLKVPENEKVYGVPASATSIEALRAIESHLSHVGDYLAQSAEFARDPSRFDLIRAVKETAKWDEQLAKNMVKARLAEKSVSPVAREYPDGSYWQQLTKPGQFVRESDAMGHSVRGYEPEKPQGKVFGLAHVHNDVNAPGELGKAARKTVELYDKYINTATDKEINNRATNAALQEYSKLRNVNLDPGDWVPASGDSGHPSYGVGGWDAIKSGDAKIYSLRDAKGESHATIEVELTKNRDAYGGYTEGEYNILQIKGKQNRAPAGKYLAAVQDFIRNPPEGKAWGEVGDLENTGLVDLNNIGTFSSATKVKELQRIIQEQGRYVTKDVLEKLFNSTDHPSGEGTVYWPRERGSADPRLLAGIAAAGGLAAYLSQNPDDAEAVAAGFAGLALKGKAGAGKAVSALAGGLDHAFGAISTRLGNISPQIRLRARDMERLILQSTEQSLQQVDPFLVILRKTPEGSPLDLALLNGNTAEITRQLRDVPGAPEAYRQVETMLRDFETVHKSLGRFKEGLASYFPRLVNDLDGLKKALGQEQRTSLENALTNAEAKMIKEQQRSLTEVETSIIVNDSLQARPFGSHLPGYAHKRGVDTVTPELRPFYAPPAESLLRYVSAAIQDIEAARFFGKDLETHKSGGKVMTDYDGSIGNIVARELKDKTITYEQANDLRTLLKARFEGGERSMSGAAQDIRNLNNVALLGQFGSAATQIGDSVMTVYHHSLMPALQAVKGKLTGNSRISTKEFGLVNHIAEEIGSNRYTGKALQAVFKANGFSLIDQFGKSLNLNAGFIKNSKLAQSQKGQAELARKWAPAFGEEFPQLLEDLRSGQVTERVKSLLWSELSDAQPISKMEMPQAYLENPNGRLLYQMKTYMLKQMDVIRRDAYNEAKAGNWVRAGKNLVAVASALALSNIPGDVIKNWLSGRDADLDKINYMEALLRNFGLNRYNLDQAASGKPLEVARDMVVPPFKHYQELYNSLKPDASPKQEARGVKYVPLVGRALYDREFGGNQARERVEKIQERIKLRDADEERNPGKKAARLKRMRDRELKQLGQQP